MRVLASVFAFLTIALLSAPANAADFADAAPITTAPITTAALRTTCNPALVVPGVVELRRLGCPDRDHRTPTTNVDNGGGKPDCGYGSYKGSKKQAMKKGAFDKKRSFKKAGFTKKSAKKAGSKKKSAKRGGRKGKGKGGGKQS